jgi:hypothetical protein
VPARVNYNWQVRPILADNCFSCHGRDEKKRRAGLRLDEADSAYARAIVRNKPDESALIRRITSTDASVRMPPASTHKVLSAKDVATLRDWIAQGAVYEPFWAFAAPHKDTPPSSKFDGRVRNDIDRFVFARLEKEGFTPVAEAKKEILINRVALDVTGLPPTLKEVDAFLADTSPRAYERVVDRLLASHAYGERMAANWLDVARYSDSDGLLDDHHERLMWPWRDWAIAAFNKNLRYDQFATWQIAGDLLPNPTREQVLATTFLRAGRRSTENGAIDEEFRVEYAIDRTNTVGTAFLGLTVECARCHDHKYDPISHKAFYSLEGFFNNVPEPGFYSRGMSGNTAGPILLFTDAGADAKLTAARASIRAAEQTETAARRVTSSAVLPQVAALLKSGGAEKLIQDSLSRSMVAYYPFETVAPIPDDQLPKARPRNQAPRELVSQRRRGAQAPGPMVAPGAVPTTPEGPKLPFDYIRSELQFSPSGLPGGKPAVLEAASLRPGLKGNAFYFTDLNRGFLPEDAGWYERTQAFSYDVLVYPGAVYEDSVVVSHRESDTSGGAGYKLMLENNRLALYLMHSRPFNMLAVVSRGALPVKQWTEVSFTYDGSSRASGLKLYVDGAPVETEVRRDHLFLSILPTEYSSIGNDLFVGVQFGKRFRETTLKDGAIDELRIFNRALTPVEISYLHRSTSALEPPVLRPEVLERELAALAIDADPRVVTARNRLSAARQEENAILSLVPQVMVMADHDTPNPTYELIRGQYNQRGDEVKPEGLGSVFPWDAALPRNRLGLAKWFFDPKNPLTARVFVNRLWQMNFGRGLVETANDFGSQGSAPSHPELLDWLAVDFVQSGWDIKRLEKMIVMSATYRESSDSTPELNGKDPLNLLLARGVRRRMSAEQVRDHALAVSGLLVRTVGGPPVYPYQPDGLWAPGVTPFAYPDATDVPAEEHHRRSLYTFNKRSLPPPSMTIFDSPERQSTQVRRRTSNTPLQALDLMNDPQYVEAYRALATQALHVAGDIDVRLTWIFRSATRRMPSADELGAMHRYYQAESERFAARKADADALVHVGVTPVDSSLDVAQLAALTHVAGGIMNSPDAYTVR